MDKFHILAVLMTLSIGSMSFAQDRSPDSTSTSDERLRQEIAQNSQPVYDAPPTNSNTLYKPVLISHEASLITLEPVFGYAFSTFTGGGGNVSSSGNYNGAGGTYSFTTTSGMEGGVGVLVGRGSFQFESGLIYAERGGKENYQYGVTSWDINFQNQYLEMPLMVRYTYSPSREIKLFAKAGVVMAMLQNSTGAVENAENYYTYGTASYNPYNYYYGTLAQNSNNTKSDFASVDPRWAAGIGGKVRINNLMSWVLEADYQSSINPTSTIQPNGYYGTTNMSLTMTSYGINTGLAFSL